MADGILDFLSREAGQRRRRDLEDAITYYIPPELRGLLGLAAEANPVVSAERAGQDAQVLFAPDQALMDRLAAGGRMASNMAGIAAPAVVAGRAGVPAAAAVMEGLLGGSPAQQAAADMARGFVVDESGALRLYHGSPHDFDRFDMSKIGTGEGAQAYGYGLYFGESEPIARHYRDTLARGIDGSGLEVRIDNATVATPTTDQVRAARFGVDATANGLQGRIAEAQRRLAKASPVDELGLGISDRDMVQGEIDDLMQRLNAVQGLAGRIEMAPAGRLYEVNVNANPADFLDFDAPWDAQPEAVKRHFAHLARGGRAPTGEDLAQRIEGPLWAEEAAQAGIPGIRYLDAGSRGAGDGSRNYVVFDDKLIDIVRKYGIAGAAAMLGMSQYDVAQAMEQQQPQGLLFTGAQ